MSDQELKTYFKEQVRAIINRSESSPDGFMFYFANHQPKDEEILGLLTISAAMSTKNGLRESFPSPLEALAALTPSARADLCKDFRKALKSRLRELVPA